MHLFSGRFIIGLNIGIFDSSYVSYVGEILLGRTRGMFCSCVVLSFNFGTTLAYLLGTYCAYDDTSLILLVLSLLCLLSTLYLVESPYFLLMRGDTEKALQNLAWLRNQSAKQVEPELAEMNTSTEKNVKFSELLDNLRKPEVYKSCCIVSSLGIVGSLIGTTISSYANVILPTSELISSNLFAVFFSFLTMLVICVASQLIDRCGRRALLIPGFLLMSVAFVLLGVLFYLQDHRILQIPYFPWLIFTILTSTYLWYQMAVNLPTTVVRSEIFPSRFKNIGVNANIILNASTNFTASYFFLQIVDYCGTYLNFLIFSAASLVALVIVYCFLPETKGKTLVEIQTILMK